MLQSIAFRVARSLLLFIIRTTIAATATATGGGAVDAFGHVRARHAERVQALGVLDLEKVNVVAELLHFHLPVRRLLQDVLVVGRQGGRKR